MNAKRYLSEISNIERNIGVKKEKIISLKCIAENCSPHLSGMPHNPHKSSSHMADAVCKIIDLENEIKRDSALLEKKKIFLLDLIGQLENTNQQIVLIKRYFEHWSWDRICRFTYYSRSWVNELHKQGISALDEVFLSVTEIP